MPLAVLSAYLLSISQVNYTLLLIVSIAAVLFSAGLLSLLPDVKNQPTDAILESQPKLLKRALKIAVHDTRIRSIIAWLAIIAGFIGWYEEYTPLFDSTAGIATKYVPLVISCALVVNILASLVAPRFEVRGRASKALLIFGASAMIIFSTLGWWVPVVIILAHGGLVLLRILRILLDAELQHAANSRVRATLGSIAGLASYPITIGVALTFALLSDHLNDFQPFRWIGIVVFMCGVILLLNSKKSTDAN